MKLPAWLTSINLYLLVASVAFGWTVQGWRLHGQITQIKLNARNDLAKRLSQVRDEEAGARRVLQARADAFKKERDDAKTDRDLFISGVRSGTIRLSVPIVTRATGTTPADSTIAGGSGGQARAELEPAFAERITAIAFDGDDAIRQLNACIDSYNAIRQQFNVQTE